MRDILRLVAMRIGAAIPSLIGVVLKVGLRAEAMLFAAHTQQLGVPTHIAQVSDSFQHPVRGLFDETARGRDFIKRLLEARCWPDVATTR